MRYHAIGPPCIARGCRAPGPRASSVSGSSSGPRLPRTSGCAPLAARSRLGVGAGVGARRALEAVCRAGHPRGLAAAATRGERARSPMIPSAVVAEPRCEPRHVPARRRRSGSWTHSSSSPPNLVAVGQGACECPDASDQQCREPQAILTPADPRHDARRVRYGARCEHAPLGTLGAAPWAFERRRRDGSSQMLAVSIARLARRCCHRSRRRSLPRLRRPAPRRRGTLGIARLAVVRPAARSRASSARGSLHADLAADPRDDRAQRRGASSARIRRQSAPADAIERSCGSRRGHGRGPPESSQPHRSRPSSPGPPSQEREPYPTSSQCERVPTFQRRLRGDARRCTRR